MAHVHLKDEPELFRRLTLWTAAFPWAAMRTLRGEPLDADLGRLLPPADVEYIAAAQHPALAVSIEMTACLAEARRRGAISGIVLTAMDRNIELLVDYLGGCERIRKTPLPFAYVVHLRRVLVLYCFTLPFALVETFGWATVLDVFLLTYTFFGIEEIGVEIEGPFGDDANDLPLEEFCEGIDANLLALTRPRISAAPVPGS